VRSRFTTILFEAANRAGPTLAALAAAGAGERNAVVARELTKQFEEFRRGTVAELARECDESPPRGEVVLVIGGAPDTEISESELAAAARAARAEGMSPRDVTEHLMQDLGAARNVAYRIAHGSE
jgi:16S rRNA (cytidine1402-2'-O)-methyltransferase